MFFLKYFKDKSYEKVSIITFYIIVHSSDFIDETKNVRSFGKANLWASIGGYVGMILGFSFLHAPDIFFSMIKYAKSRNLMFKGTIFSKNDIK